MVELQTSGRAHSGSDKTSKRYKYKLYVALQVVLEVDNESNHSDLSD